MHRIKKRYIFVPSDQNNHNMKTKLSDVSDSTVNFIIWMTKNTSSIQSNVRSYKGKMYFTDRRIERGRDNDGGIEDLWKVYVKEMIG